MKKLFKILVLTAVMFQVVPLLKAQQAPPFYNEIQQFKKEESGWRKMVLVTRIKEWELGDKKVIKIFLMSDVGLSLVDNIKYSIVNQCTTCHIKWCSEAAANCVIIV